MKKTRFLALVLVVAIALMGAGYASWTDYFSVVSTVETGTLDMQIDNAYFYDGDNLGEIQRAWTEASIVSQDPNDKDNSLVVTAANLYPGADVRLDIYSSNHGTVPCDFDSASVEFISGDWNLFNELTARGAIRYDQDGTGTIASVARSFGYGANNKLTDLPTNLSGVLNDMILYPGGTLYFDDTEDGCIRFGLPYSAGDYYQDKECTFRIKFNFGQPDPAHGLPTN